MKFRSMPFIQGLKHQMTNQNKEEAGLLISALLRLMAER